MATYPMPCFFRPVQAWIPTNAPGCSLWVRSDFGITKDGNNRIEKWADQTVNHYDLSQGVQNQKPIYTENLIGNIPGLDFLGIFSTSGATMLNENGIATILNGTNKPISVFLVCRLIDPYENPDYPYGAFMVPFSLCDPNGWNNYISDLKRIGYPPAWGWYNCRGGVDKSFWVGAPDWTWWPLGSETDFATLLVDSGTLMNYWIKRSGADLNQIVSNFNSATNVEAIFSRFALGDFFGDGWHATYYFRHYLFEIAIYNAEVGETDRANLFNYANQRYGI